MKIILKTIGAFMLIGIGYLICHFDLINVVINLLKK